jgi:ribosomal protein S18 acetylase RimI-like enzyme
MPQSRTFGIYWLCRWNGPNNICCNIHGHLQMINLPPSCRHATKADAFAMAELVNMAGEGLPLYLWSKMAAANQSPWELGQERAQRETGAFSYRNTIVLEHAGETAACLIGYPLTADASVPDYSKIPPMFVPLQQLEDLAPDTWYVNVLATYPSFRRKGFGQQLLQVADELAAGFGKRGLSIIVADSNLEARKLYERRGYGECASRPMVKETWQNSGLNWILLVKEL